MELTFKIEGEKVKIHYRVGQTSYNFDGVFGASHVIWLLGSIQRLDAMYDNSERKLEHVKTILGLDKK